MRNQHLKAAAESFAGISPLESACYHYIYDGFASVYQDVLYNHYYKLLLEHPEQIKPNYISSVVNTALIELRYPLPKVDASYAWSSNQRADASGIARSTWSRNQLSNHVNLIINEIRLTARSVYFAISSQLHYQTEPS